MTGGAAAAAASGGGGGGGVDPPPPPVPATPPAAHALALPPTLLRNQLTPGELAFISAAPEPPPPPPAWLRSALLCIRAEDARVAAALALQSRELAAARERHARTRARLAGAAAS